jgi:hypothetical protein
MLKDRRHRKTMTNNGLDIQTISTKQTDFQTDRVLLLDQVTEKKAKVNPSHFLKFLIASRTNGTFASRTSRHTNPSLQKSRFFCKRTERQILTLRFCKQ